jgi:hypothetical protein
MLLIATFLTIHFGEWRQSWHGMPRRAHVGTDSPHVVHEDNEGVIAGIDLDNGKVVFTRVLDTPAGFATHNDQIYIASMYGNRILVLDRTLEIIDSFATRLMNDLHSISRSEEGLLITSSGTDAILELSSVGEPLWDWLATENGYCRSPSSHDVRIVRTRDYRKATIGTAMQATHCNSAISWKRSGRDVILATFFHQGMLIEVDRSTGHAVTLVRGMQNPHSIRRYSDGWIVSDSRSSSVLLLGEDFWIESVIESDFNWVQDALQLDKSRLLIADANNSRLVILDVVAGKMLDYIEFPSEWKIYQVEIADAK